MNNYPRFFNTGAEYAEALRYSTEAAPIYHYGVLLTIIGARLRRKVWFNYGRLLYPNLYTALVGASGLARKTTAIRLGEGIKGDIVELHGLSTAEGLLQKLTVVPDVLIVFEELASLYQKAKKQEKSAALIPMLAKLYDTPEKEDLLTKSAPLTVREPTVSILSATTPEWLEKSMAFEDIMGGSANRFLFLVGSPLPPNPSPRKPDLELLAAKLDRRVQQARGELEWEEHAEELWSVYYNKLHSAQQSTLRATLSIRIPDITLKVAMIMHVLEGTGNIILPETLQAAIDFMEFAQRGIDEVSPLFSGLEMKILKVIEEGGEISKGRLHEKLGGRINGQQLSMALDMLVKFHRVGVTESGKLVKLKVV